MMRADDKHASSGTRTTPYFQFDTSADQTKSPSFNTLPLPNMGLIFPPRPPPKHLKRGRAAADIDGEHSCMQKKKRRLRLVLITSRLSPQFSHPATNIVDRGSSKIAVWAKQKSIGRNLLRKAAILNRIRREPTLAGNVHPAYGSIPVEQAQDQEELEMARSQFYHGSIDTYTRPVISKKSSVPPSVAIRRGGRFEVSGSPTGSPIPSRSPSPTPQSPPAKDNSALEYRSPNEAYAFSPPRASLPRKDYLPLPPSPLGLSNYDAFDTDDYVPNSYSHLDEEDYIPTSLWGDQDDEEDTVPFSASAITPSLSLTVQTRADEIAEIPGLALYSDFDVLNHDEAVFGDYDQVDEGANAIWPSTLEHEAAMPCVGSSSPDFPALFATTASKRTDSFATSSYLPSHLSPNFQASTGPCVSPNFAPSTISPPISPNFAPASTSPNFPPVEARPHQRTRSMPEANRPDCPRTWEGDADAERARQTELMFMRFGS